MSSLAFRQCRLHDYEGSLCAQGLARCMDRSLAFKTMLGPQQLAALNSSVPEPAAQLQAAE